MGCSASAPQNATAEILLSRTAERLLSKNYTVGETLGVGCFGQVHRCVHKTTSNVCAVKIVKTSRENEQLKALRELEVWKQVGAHANVVVLLESYSSPDATCFVMQRCMFTVSEMFNRKGKSFCYGDILDAFYQVFLGLQHVHAMNVVHRDIKASNLLVDFGGVVKIADFGASVIMPEGGVSGLVGSVPYMSPEMVKGRIYDFRTDVWSCAVAIYGLVYGEYPYDPVPLASPDERKHDVLKAIATDKPKPKYEPAPCLGVHLGLGVSVGGPQRAPYPPTQMQTLIQTLLQRKADQRPDAGQSANLVLTAKTALEITGCARSIKPIMEVDLSSESTRCTNATGTSSRGSITRVR